MGKNKKEKKQKLKESKGITLIALVITIIVLLIIAGVTIAILTGENGILTKAQSAKIQNEKAGIKEKIDLAVQASRINGNLDASIDTTILETELNKINGLSSIEKQGNNGSLPWLVTVNGFKFQIKEDGTVEAVEGISLSQTSLKMVAGQAPVTITATLTEGLTGTITWSSSNTNVATVNNGTITLVGTSGTADITAEIGGHSAKCTVTVVSKVTAISVADFEVETDQEKAIVVSTTPSSNVEELTYTYTLASGNANVTLDESAGKVRGVTAGTAEITITGTGVSGTNVSTTCTVTVKEAPKPIGEYVEYEVEYTDISSAGYNFTKSDGWRILSLGTKKVDGSYSDAKIISTGVPAGIYYNSNQQVNNSWWDITKSGSAYQAASGLSTPAKFETIVFNKKTGSEAYSAGDYNLGYYTEIKNGETTYTSDNVTAGTLFKTDKAEEVDTITLAELNSALNRSTSSTDTLSVTNDPKSLFYLRGLNQYNYSSTTECAYWLASAYSSDNMWYVQSGRVPVGYIGGINSNLCSRVRVVVSLNSDIYKDGDIWKIK